MKSEEERKEIVKNVRVLVSEINVKVMALEKETEKYDSDGSNYDSLNRKCYELRDLVNELIFETRWIL